MSCSKVRWWLPLLASVSLMGQVRVYEQEITMPTWQVGPPQVHSEFGDSGQEIYPYTLRETLTNKKVEQKYKGVFLENEYIKVLVLPDIGGRLHGAEDKTNGYVWLYWQRTIKPGLISMTGAWISGGIEWNFPHGHRPSCFQPVDHRIVNHPDGSATVWVGETEPIFRMRWLVGMTIYPGRSYIRCDYVFINPTNQRNSFMFWATSATHANEWSQAQYPGDMVTGHGKHQFWNWPINNGVDLTWWKNVPNASSFFAFNNPSEWFGTYDHKAEGGMLHFANVHVMPGKKLWTWGSGPSGRIWEDILSDGGGAYFEPQAGAWSDNQPDYHWMAPNEVKVAHDYWYPVRDIRGFRNANTDFAVNTELKDGKAFAGVYATGRVEGVRVVLRNAKTGRTLSEATTAIAPDKPYTVEVEAGKDTSVYDLHLAVYDAAGKLAIELQRKPPQKVELPEGQKDPGDPAKMNSDELYHAGEWLDRFRRTREALTYYKQALELDPGDSRVNIEMGFLALKQGQWQDALRHFDKALVRDADNSRIYFGKGLAFQGLGKQQEAYDNLYRATYTYDYYSPAYFNLARIDLARGDNVSALAKLDEAFSQNGRFTEISALSAAAHRRLGDHIQALVAADKALESDPMNFMAGYERLLALKATGEDASAWEKTWTSYMRDEVQNYLELAVAYGSAGLYDDADVVLARFAGNKDASQLHPMVGYFRGHFKELAGQAEKAKAFYKAAQKGPVVYTNPHRLEGEAALEAALRAYPEDAHAHLFLGNLLYARGQREEGFAHWKTATEIDKGLELAWRNVGYGLRFLKKDFKASYTEYQTAARLGPQDARVLLELDEVAQQLGVPAEKRLALLEQRYETVMQRDDLISRLIDLRLESSDPSKLEATYALLRDHHFHSWEGRYGIHHAWVEVNEKLGDLAMEKKDYQTALEHYRKATEYPKNLEVAPRTPDFRAHVYWNLAKVYRAMGSEATAGDYLKKITAEHYGKTHLGVYYQALAWKALGDEAKYRSLLDRLEKEARKRTSGAFEYRGAPETIGHYLSSLVLREKGDAAAAKAEYEKAIKRNPLAARLAVREAQLDVAGAHQ